MESFFFMLATSRRMGRGVYLLRNEITKAIFLFGRHAFGEEFRQPGWFDAGQARQLESPFRPGMAEAIAQDKASDGHDRRGRSNQAKGGALRSARLQGGKHAAERQSQAAADQQQKPPPGKQDRFAAYPDGNALRRALRRLALEDQVTLSGNDRDPVNVKEKRGHVEQA